MPLANILVPPPPMLQRAYDFSHWQDHLEIVQAINANAGTFQFVNSTSGVIAFTSTFGALTFAGSGIIAPLPVYPIQPRPIAEDAGADWKRRHQAFHTDMNMALGLPSGRDLTGDMDDDWYYSNWQEHVAARAKLGI